MVGCSFCSILFFSFLFCSGYSFVPEEIVSLPYLVDDEDAKEYKSRFVLSQRGYHLLHRTPKMALTINTPALLPLFPFGNAAYYSCGELAGWCVMCACRISCCCCCCVLLLLFGSPLDTTTRSHCHKKVAHCRNTECQDKARQGKKNVKRARQRKQGDSPERQTQFAAQGTKKLRVETRQGR